MRIEKVALPGDSMLNASHKAYDYIDSFKDELSDFDDKFNSFDIGKAFFQLDHDG